MIVLKHGICLTVLCGLTLIAAGCKSKTNQKQTSESLQQQNTIDFTKAFAWSQSYDAKSQNLLIQVELKDGFHAYAAGEKIGQPVALLIFNQNGWRLDGLPQLPAGETKDLENLGTTQILEKNFVIKAKVVDGKGSIRGALKMQLCTEHACDRPREHTFEIGDDK